MIQYLVQVTAYTGAMWLLYQLLLRDRPLHRFNRAYLLSAVLLPIALPLLKLPETLRPKQEAKPIVAVLQEVTVGGAVQEEFLSWSIAIPLAYLVVVLAVLLVKLAGYIKMRRVINRSNKELHGGYILLKHTGYGPGSWGRYIFLPEGDVDEIIIRHERAHIQLRHSHDIIFMSIAQAVLWPNLFIHLLKKELAQVHEFQSDAAVGIAGEAYTQLLLASVFGTCTLPFTHSFIIHPIKRRIMMLHNRKNGRLRGILASVTAVALLAGIVTMQSCEQKKETESMLTGVKVEKTEDSIFAFVHKMPNPGYNVNEKLGSLIEYPEEAKENKIEGRVPVKFVVGKDGKISGIHVIGKNVDRLLRDAAIKAIAQLPDWIPGEDEHGNKVAVYFTLPVNFKLDGEDKKTSFAEMKQKLEYEVEAMRAKGYDVKLVDTDSQGPALLTDATNPPDRKFVMLNDGMAADEVLAKFGGDGIKVQEVNPQTSEFTTEDCKPKTITLRLGNIAAN
ncbi:MAG: TonB family protein [Taibaiella sp.]|nr:TonB family protein [Taibaiella sp.]